jgi:hypothetical protein
VNYADHEILLYDLSNRPASFDFVTCLSTAIAHGIKHVRFVMDRGWKPKNYTNPVQRFNSIVEPAVTQFGLTYSVGDRIGVEVSHFFPACVDAYRKHGRIGKIKVQRGKGDYVTITLRKSRTPERDSNEAEWLKFAADCDRKCIIIRDYDERPLSLEDRVALYSNAYTNMMVINGPLTLCIHSDLPYISMRTIGGVKSGSTSPDFMRKIGIEHGFQFPWALPDQRLSYLDDTAENIMAEYQATCQMRMAA